jgi:hypothetical protein
MLIPDEEFAVGILDALDDRGGSSVSAHLYGLEARLEWVRVRQQRRMVAVLHHWLERQVEDAQPEDPLRQAMRTVCNSLGAARDTLGQRMAEMEAMAGRGASHVP